MYGGRSDGSKFMDILRTGTRTWRLVARFAKLGNDIKNFIGYQEVFYGFSAGRMPKTLLEILQESES